MKPLATMTSTKQPVAVKKPAPFNNNYINSGKKQEEMLMQQFAANRGKLAQDKASAMDQSAQGFDRLQARVGGTVGGALEKARQLSQNDLNQKFAQADTEATAAEAAAKSGLYSKQQELGIQQKQFDTQNSQFAQQMAFNLKELDENKRTNAINALIALKDAGAKNDAGWSALLSGMKSLGYTNIPKNFGLGAPATQGTPGPSQGMFNPNQPFSPSR